ncbi:hypothetical protein GGS23DRAFT_619474 [Durotheca rogersii]|uniref:uncharacterized protein n=1 Tax=Durotheca rogersii TaxID=419775 RepID=UPI00221F5779|nr:uncharacterized protein GGS23DRAFT_619474 [Durotheca rogersii]KAI5864822.1 hypothetical protein GGS23DRAFT_619474 [Durotheca rogersii]
MSRVCGHFPASNSHSKRRAPEPTISCSASPSCAATSFGRSDSRVILIALSVQAPAAVCPIVGALFVPFSPRWRKFYLFPSSLQDGSSNFINQEMIQIREQIDLKKMQNKPAWLSTVANLFSRQYLRRTVTTFFVLCMTQLTSSSVVQNFQNSTPPPASGGQQALLISGPFILADKWPRARTMWSGSLVLCGMISICMALSAVYENQSNSNLASAREAIVFIFLYSMCYAIFFNGIVWVVCSELFPFFWTKDASVAVYSKTAVAIVLSRITPLVIANVGWRYYSLFIAINFAAAVVYFFLLPETSDKSLYEITELFEDTRATGHIREIDVDAKDFELNDPAAETRSRA